MTAPVGTLLARRYHLIAAMAEGGVGRVYRARDQLLDREVAVKVLRPEVAATATARDRFHREARAAATLSHRHVAALYDYGEDGDTPFLVMECIRGETLAQRLSSGSLPLADALRLGAEVADALAHAHARGVIHRDVKPANVMLAADGSVKVTDFGTARFMGEPAVTATGTVVGTPSYLAPELVTGGPVGPATDLYSLGAVLYEMLEGRPPFVDHDPMVVLGQHLHAPVPSVSPSLAARAPGLARLVHSLLQKDPDLRPADAAAVGRTLRRVAAEAATPRPVMHAPPRPAPAGPRAKGTSAPAGRTEVASLKPPAVATEVRTRVLADQPKGPSRPVVTARTVAWVVVITVLCLALIALGFMIASTLLSAVVSAMAVPVGGSVPVSASAAPLPSLLGMLL